MGTENGLNGKNGGPKNKGPKAFKSLADAGKALQRAAGMAPTPTETPPPSSESISQNDPQYQSMTRQFAKEEIPLEVWDYALGLRHLPRNHAPKNPDERRIGKLLNQYAFKIQKARDAGYRSHTKKSEADSDASKEWNRKADERYAMMAKSIPELADPATPKEFVAYARGEANLPDSIIDDPKWGALARKTMQASYEYAMLPMETGNLAAYQSSRTKDMPSMPSNVQDLIRKNPAMVNYAIMMFTRNLRDREFSNPLLTKFAHYFAEMIEEKAFRANPNARDRVRYENAFWSLLHFNTVKQPSGKSSRPTLFFRHSEIESQLKRFLDIEGIRRLEEERSAPGADVAKIDAELKSLRTRPEYFIERSKFYDGDVPTEVAANPKLYEEKVSTLVEAFGNRLYVTASQLPITESDLDDALKELAAEPDKPIEQLQANLESMHKILGSRLQVLSATVAGIERDVTTFEKYLTEGGTWDASIQEGFELLIRSILKNIQITPLQKDWAENALADERINEQGKKLFSKHLEHSNAIEKTLRGTEERLLRLWYEHHPSANAAPLNVEVRSMRERIKEFEEEQDIDRAVFETIRDKMVQARKTKNFRAVAEIEALLNEYLSLSNKK